ncbi:MULTISPECIES: FAD-dependent oxidoreductase [unclassified Paenibacillus]|uniref:FAD-dependent oxidoreductase n=1 Tax=unclassified Paenibacillus TaxID=185978 RepID=UPI001C1076A3|nr:MULTISPECIES: FAD-dependent oxidoreductase [unclassified Paenibacillus]MBU5445322.1 FAD-dependent oxidoreductase [Paenibacillus sp. MSJ-34]CAH0118546.1 Ferredoxin--NADP reductase [Paenibacillus sp. CECT 9249]
MYDIIIVGGGTAGGSAALYAAKAGKKTLVLDGNASMTKRAMLYNHYGIKEITGPDLIRIGREQAEHFGAEWKEEKVTGLASSDQGVVVHTETAQYEAKHVILATGATAEVAGQSGVKVKDGTEPRIKTVIDVDAQGKTNVRGVWAAGTVAGVSVHTIITAGDGAKVAINVISELNGERYVDHDLLK